MKETIHEPHPKLKDYIRSFGQDYTYSPPICDPTVPIVKRYLIRLPRVRKSTVNCKRCLKIMEKK